MITLFSWWVTLSRIATSHTKWDWLLMLVAVVTMIEAFRAVHFSKKQAIPSFAIAENPNKAGTYKIINSNATITARITRFGYIPFRGKRINVEQEVNQYTTYVSTDWGQELMFDPQPLREDIYAFYVYELHSNKTYYFYPNGRYKSLVGFISGKYRL